MSQFLDILKAVFVRCMLVLHALVAVWRVAESYKNDLYWIVACILVLLFAESCYTIVSRRGQEYERFTPSFLFYLCTLLTCIWLLELDKTEKYIIGQAQLLDQQTNSSTTPIPAPSLTPNTWIMLVEEMFPYLLFLSRWIMPRGRVRKKQLAELLFTFVGIGGDIMEYFSLLGEEAVRPSRHLCYVVLAIWSLAVLQFAVTITVIHQPERKRGVSEVTQPPDRRGSRGGVERRRRFWREVSAVGLSILMQDLPFLIVRLYVLASCKMFSYSLIFFATKNAMILSLLLYKLSIACENHYRFRKIDERSMDEDNSDSDDDGDDNDIKENECYTKKKTRRIKSLYRRQVETEQSETSNKCFPNIKLKRFDRNQETKYFCPEQDKWSQNSTKSEVTHDSLENFGGSSLALQEEKRVISFPRVKRYYSQGNLPSAEGYRAHFATSFTTNASQTSPRVSSGVHSLAADAVSVEMESRGTLKGLEDVFSEPGTSESSLQLKAIYYNGTRQSSPLDRNLG